MQPRGGASEAENVTDPTPAFFIEDTSVWNTILQRATAADQSIARWVTETIAALPADNG